VPVPFQLPGSALSASPSCATPPPAGRRRSAGPVLVAGPSSETRKKAEGMKYSLVELKASVAELWSLSQRAGVGEGVEVEPELVDVVRRLGGEARAAGLDRGVHRVVGRVQRVGQRWPLNVAVSRARLASPS
jgi:hypothetical protein